MTQNYLNILSVEQWVPFLLICRISESLFVVGVASIFCETLGKS